MFVRLSIFTVPGKLKLVRIKKIVGQTSRLFSGIQIVDLSPRNKEQLDAFKYQSGPWLVSTDDRRGFVQQRHRGNAKLPVLGITSRILHTNGAVSILVYILVGVYRESNYQNHSCIEMKTLDVTVPCWFCVYFVLMHWNKLTTFPPQTLTANNINIIEPLRVMLLNPVTCNSCSLYRR